MSEGAPDSGSLDAGALEIIRKRMDVIDSLASEWRALVHDFGWGVVAPFYLAGIKPRQTKHLIDHVLNGSFEIRDRLSSTRRVSHAGERVSKALSSLNLGGNGQSVAEMLRRQGAVIVPLQASSSMIAASLNALPRRQPMKWVTDVEKHRLRLNDALAAAAEEELRIISHD
jgi:hypothetical protein